MVILEAEVCGSVKLSCVILRCFSNTSNPFISIVEGIMGRVRKQNTSLYNAIQFNSSTNYVLQNDHTVELIPLSNRFNKK